MICSRGGQTTFFSSAIISPMNLKREGLALEAAVAFTACGKLLYLLVKLMGTATRTVLVQLKALRVILLVLLGSIIPLLAFRASKVDDDSGFPLFGHYINTFSLLAPILYSLLLKDLGKHAGSHSAAAFADSKAQTFLQGNRIDKSDLHL